GVIAVENNEPHSLAEQHLRQLTRLAREAAGVLHRLWTLEHLQRKAAQLEVLGAVAQELAGKLEPEELMHIVTRESHRLAHCQLATLELYDARQRRVRLQAVYPPGDHFATA